MLTQLHDRQLFFQDLVPQAEFYYPTDDLEKRYALIRDSDDLHDFLGAAFVINNSLPFTIKHYDGKDKNQWTIYFERQNEVEIVSKYVNQILSDMKVPLSALTWHRSLNEDL